MSSTFKLCINFEGRDYLFREIDTLRFGRIQHKALSKAGEALLHLLIHEYNNTTCRLLCMLNTLYLSRTKKQDLEHISRKRYRNFINILRRRRAIEF